MHMREIVRENPILAIMRNIPSEKLIDYVEAIRQGGVNFFEVAMNTPDAADQIRTLKEHFGDQIILGAGTVITVERAKAAVEAGAQFMVTPSTDIPVLEYCRDHGIPMTPGVLTPTDVSTCLSYGFDVMKLFPAGDMPMNYVKSLKGPFDGTDYVAVGGVTSDNMEEFLRRGCIGLGIGSGMMPKEVVKNGDWEAGTTHVKAMVEKVKAVLENK